MNAIYKINLIPSDLKKRRFVKILLKKNILFALLAILIFITINIALWAWQYSFELEKTSTNKQIEQLNTNISKLSKTEEQIKILETKFTNYQSLDKVRLTPKTLVTKLAEATPKEVTINSLTIDLTKDPEIDITGEALTRRDVVIFSDQLNGGDIFTKAEFFGTTETKKDDKTIITFNLSAKIKQKNEK